LVRLEASIRCSSELDAREIAAMFGLYEHYYGGADAAVFRADLAQKSHVILLHEDGAIRGFSALATQPLEMTGECALAIFSGDTIIDQAYWGEQALARAFCRFAGATQARHPEAVLYWFLISKGYRTYRYLDAFARRYYPHPVEPTPSDMRRRMDALARARFGEAYSSELGIVRFVPVRGYLRAPWNGVRTGLRDRPEVRYFLERNPGYVNGDELVCIAELSAQNLRSIARREFTEAYANARLAAES